MCIPFRDWHTAFNRLHVCITKLCGRQAEVIQNHENEQGEARHKKYKKFKRGGGQAYDRSSD
jgi:hypothetical protein